MPRDRAPAPRDEALASENGISTLGDRAKVSKDRASIPRNRLVVGDKIIALKNETLIWKDKSASKDNRFDGGGPDSSFHQTLLQEHLFLLFVFELKLAFFKFILIPNCWNLFLKVFPHFCYKILLRLGLSTTD